jgi:hypothetical protein
VPASRQWCRCQPGPQAWATSSIGGPAPSSAAGEVAGGRGVASAETAARATKPASVETIVRTTSTTGAGGGSPARYSPFSRCLGLKMSSIMASFKPLRYPIPNPTAQPAAAQAKTTSQTRAASNAQTIEASAERSQVIYWARMDPTTNHPASHVGRPDASRRRRLRLRRIYGGRLMAPARR